MSRAASKTMEPSSTRYSYYRSSASKPAATSKPKKHHHYKTFIVILLILIATPILYGHFDTSADKAASTVTKPAKTIKKVTAPVKKVAPVVAAAPPATNYCANNTLPQLILVSISKQHLWACDGSTTEYDSAVVTGDEQYADTLTPLGTYHIYAKSTDQYLRGSDENGSWDDFVHYWMPFLDNQYGAYGLHDATWRTTNEFGNININTSSASNGCVELPLATAAWLYNWDEVGTTVTIES